MWEVLSDILAKIDRTLANAESSRGADVERLMGQLHQLTSWMCHRAGEVAGLPCVEWCEIGHGLRGGIQFAIETGQRIRQSVKAVRRKLAPLLEVAAEYKRRESQECLA